MSVSAENIRKSEQAKEKGNTCFRNQDYSSALNHYNTALAYNPFEAALYFNRAILYIKDSLYEKAIEDCNKTLNLNKEYIKAYERRAQAYFGLKDYSRAIKDLILTLELEPDKRQVRELLEQCYQRKISEKKVKKTLVIRTFEPPLENDYQLDEDLLLYDSVESIEKVVKSCVILQKRAKEYRKLGKYRISAQESLKGLSLLSQVIAKKTEKIEKIKTNLVKVLVKSYTYLLEFDQALKTIKKTLKLPFTNNHSQNAFHEHTSFIHQIQGDYQQALDEILLLKNIQSSEKMRNEKKILTLKYLLDPENQRIKNLEEKKFENFIKRWKNEKAGAIDLFKKNKFVEALGLFDGIILDIFKIYDEVEILANTDLKDLIIILFNNKAIGLSRIGKYHLSCKECFNVFLYDFENVKAWFRLGKNMVELTEIYLARQCFVKIAEKEPANGDFVKELKNIEEKIKAVEGEGLGKKVQIQEIEISEVVKRKELGKVLTVEVEVKCEDFQAICSETKIENEVKVENNGLLVENTEILNATKKNSEAKNSSNTEILLKDSETTKKPKKQSKVPKSLINSIVSSVSSRFPERQAPKSYLEFISALTSIRNENNQSIPYLKVKFM